MKLSAGFYFIVLGVLSTTLVDFGLSFSNWTLILCAVLRLVFCFVALIHRMIFDDYSRASTTRDPMKFWIRMKNTFVIVAAIQQALMFYSIPIPTDFSLILLFVAKISMPLFTYLWIRRIERENLSVLQHVWFEIIGSTSDSSESKSINAIG